MFEPPKPMLMSIAIANVPPWNDKCDPRHYPKWVGIATVDDCDFVEQDTGKFVKKGWSAKIVFPDGQVKEVVGSWLHYHYRYEYDLHRI